ncbi:TOBE domain-containing protein [Marinomonas rhodophyticola]|uniref:TOBE domain-containing protein n=1 Tax=Marinomonas rhodophyticola TaxID=2992803 RepID=UPI003D17F059
MNFLDGKVISIDNKDIAVIDIAGQTIELEVDGTKISVNESVKLGIRPEHVKENTQDADIVLKIDIDVAEHLGGLTYLYGQFQGHKLTIEVSGANLTRHGESVEVGLKKQIATSLIAPAKHS